MDFLVDYLSEFRNGYIMVAINIHVFSTVF